MQINPSTTQMSPHVHHTISAVKVYLGPEGEVKVNDAAVTLPYEKMFRTSKKSTESMSVISAGRTVSTYCIDLLSSFEQEIKEAL